MTTEQNWLSNKYLVYRFLIGLGFAGAIWLYFYRIFITDQQLGVLDGLAFAIGLLAEVPTGALADKFGQDKILRLGLVLVGSGLLVNAWLEGYRSFREFGEDNEKAVAAFGIVEDIRNVVWKLGFAKSSRGKPLLQTADLPKVVDEWLEWEQSKINK